MIQLNLAGPLMHVGGSIALEVSTFFCSVYASTIVPLLMFDVCVFCTQVKRQAEIRLREHFSEPLRAQAQAAMIEEDDEDSDGAWELEPRRRILEPL
jgi:hypothetical protein